MIVKLTTDNETKAKRSDDIPSEERAGSTTVTEALYRHTDVHSVGSSSFSHLLLLLYILPSSTFLNAFKTCL